MSINDIIQCLSDTKGNCILVDNTSNQDIAEAYPRFLKEGISVVTPNKKAFSSGLDLWKAIHEEGYRPYEPYLNRGLM